MKYFLSINAYDCLDNVVATGRVRQYPDYENDHSEVVFSIATTFHGEGVTDARDWLQDVLLGLIERI